MTFIHSGLRKGVLFSALSIFSLNINAQSVGIGTTTPDPTAILDVTVPDTTGNPQGLLLPRMHGPNVTTLAGSIGAAQQGMLVYDLDSGCVRIWDGAAWSTCDEGGSSNSPFTEFAGTISNGNGTYSSDDFVFGAPQLDGDGDFNHYSRVMFDKSNYAFRAGYVFDQSWDSDSLGVASFASGENTRATGYGDVAMGTNSIARGGSSFAMGDMCVANGFNSVAMGRMSEANGGPAIAMGHFAYANGSESVALGFFNNSNGFGSTTFGQNNVADGDGSIAAGNNTTAHSYGENVFGMFNTAYVPNSVFGYDANDRLFVIGNGSGAGSESDGMVMLKDGSTIFGGSTPLGPFHVSVDNDGTPDSLFMVDNAGNVGVGTIPSGTYKIEIAGNIGTAGINEMSDARWKKNIKPFNGALQKVMQLQGVTYDWRTKEFPERNFESSRQIGFIAQEVEKVLPELVDEDANGYKSVEYSKLVSVLTEAMKEQQKLIENQQQQIDYLKAELETVKEKTGIEVEAKK